VNSTSNKPSAILDAALSAAQIKGLEAYIAWAKGGENPGVEAEVAFSTAAINGKFSIIGNSINMELPPGSTYKDVAGVYLDSLYSYTYEFVVRDLGTYWYHSHQFTEDQVPRGLYGALVVA
jgi:hypothetical protein